jgi:CoA:oxalate CoA-transferase
MMATNEAGADLPLHGLKVLDFSRVRAGPFCTAMLADAGAEAIKVEPFEGDDYRHMGLQVDGQSATFAFVNRGKRSLRLDLKHAHADAVTERLQALSGLMDVTGAREGQPTMIGESIADVAAGMFASWGVMAARDRLFEYPNL